MFPNLHLLVELEGWVPGKGGKESLLRLEVPDRFIVEGGRAVFHARDDGSWAELVQC